MTASTATRRLGSVAGLLAVVMACSSPSTGADGQHESGGSSNAAAGAGGTASGGTATGGTAGNAGDSSAPNEPPYADVTAVSASGNDNSYTFDVTIESADIDCSQYANWWEVLTESGVLVYRRILDHSHTDANGTSDPDAPGNTFTRSGGPVPIGEGDVVVVRAHMSVGGYNGRVMRGSVTGGFVEAPDIGSDFAADVESLDPQPTSCEF
jgi:hypothetical protein